MTGHVELSIVDYDKLQEAKRNLEEYLKNNSVQFIHTERHLSFPFNGNLSSKDEVEVFSKDGALIQLMGKITSLQSALDERDKELKAVIEERETFRSQYLSTLAEYRTIENKKSWFKRIFSRDE